MAAVVPGFLVSGSRGKIVWNRARRTKVAIQACKANWSTVMKCRVEER
jgi:hypothetical protein